MIGRASRRALFLQMRNTCCELLKDVWAADRCMLRLFCMSFNQNQVDLRCQYTCGSFTYEPLAFVACRPGQSMAGSCS